MLAATVAPKAFTKQDTAGPVLWRALHLARLAGKVGAWPALISLFGEGAGFLIL